MPCTKRRALFRGPPVAEANAFHATDAGGEFRAEEPGVRRFMGDASHSREPEIDGGRENELRTSRSQRTKRPSCGSRSSHERWG